MNSNTKIKEAAKANGRQWGIFDRATGRRHKPRRRGITDHAYPNQYAAEQAIAAMPPQFRGTYEARPLNSGDWPYKTKPQPDSVVQALRAAAEAFGGDDADAARAVETPLVRQLRADLAEAVAACKAIVSMPENANRADTRIVNARAIVAKHEGSNPWATTRRTAAKGNEMDENIIDKLSRAVLVSTMADDAEIGLSKDEALEIVNDSEQLRADLAEAVAALERALSIRSPNVAWTREEAGRSWNAWEDQARAIVAKHEGGSP